jgi:hypothetical protein
VAAGYVVYHDESEAYELPAEHAPVLADEESPVFLPPAFAVSASMWLDQERLVDAFRTGAGIAWGDRNERLACGVPGGSTAICVPHSRSENGKLALGAQAGPARLAAVFREAGFGSVHVAHETPFNLVLEARR